MFVVRRQKIVSIFPSPPLPSRSPAQGYICSAPRSHPSDGGYRRRDHLSPVSREMLEESEEISHHHEHSSGPALDQLPHLHHELVFGLQL